MRINVQFHIGCVYKTYHLYLIGIQLISLKADGCDLVRNVVRLTCITFIFHGTSLECVHFGFRLKGTCHCTVRDIDRNYNLSPCLSFGMKSSPQTDEVMLPSFGEKMVATPESKWLEYTVH